MSATLPNHRGGQPRATHGRVVVPAGLQRREQRRAKAKGTPSRARPSDAIRARLRAIAEQLAPDELAVLACVAERLLMGRRRYGALRLDTDPRDFAREALEEAADGLVYTAAALCRGDHTADVTRDRKEPS